MSSPIGIQENFPSSERSSGLVHFSEDVLSQQDIDKLTSFANSELNLVIKHLKNLKALN